MKYAYLRVSTEHQEMSRQEYAIKDLGIDIVFKEKISGTKKASSRPEFEKMLEVIKKGDVVYFESMSRMARSMQNLIDTTNLLSNKMGVQVVFLKENISVGGSGLDAMNSLIFNIMGAFAQFERDLISDRTKQALQAIKATGRKLGREYQYGEEYRLQAVSLREKGLTLRAIAKEMNLGLSTVNDILKRI